MSKNFYVTTPIYYPSAKPHMGHAYSSIVADFFARFKRNDGFSVQFLTGTDEHGLKIQRSAEKQGMEPKEFCNLISKTFKDLSKTLNLSNTDFIRTTEDRHIKSVQIYGLLEANGQIYMSKYEGWYSVSDEAFIKKMRVKQKDNKKYSGSGSPVEWVEEKSPSFLNYLNGKNLILKFYED